MGRKRDIMVLKFFRRPCSFFMCRPSLRDSDIVMPRYFYSCTTGTSLMNERKSYIILYPLSGDDFLRRVGGLIPFDMDRRRIFKIYMIR